MAINTNAVQSFTDQELLNLFRNALAQLAISEEVEVNGRRVRRSQIPSIRETITWLEQRINDDANGTAGGNIALAQFGDEAFSRSSGGSGTS